MQALSRRANLKIRLCPTGISRSVVFTTGISTDAVLNIYYYIALTPTGSKIPSLGQATQKKKPLGFYGGKGAPAPTSKNKSDTCPASSLLLFLRPLPHPTANFSVSSPTERLTGVWLCLLSRLLPPLLLRAALAVFPPAAPLLSSLCFIALRSYR